MQSYSQLRSNVPPTANAAKLVAPGELLEEPVNHPWAAPAEGKSEPVVRY